MLLNVLTTYDFYSSQMIYLWFYQQAFMDASIVSETIFENLFNSQKILIGYAS